jgi:glycosyltransferase involved in cell wall biosynthesis
MNLKVLFIITGSFPYDHSKEDTFINPEIQFYLKYFDKIIFCPSHKNEKKYELLDGLEYTDSLAEFKENMYLINLLFSRDIRILIRQIFYNFLKLNFLNLSFIKYVTSYFLQAKKTQKWLNYYLSQFADYDITIYTYWCDHNTLGASLTRKNNRSIKVVSRAHNVDLYEERNPFEIIPFRHFVLENINTLIPISNSGLLYLRTKYPNFAKDKYFSRLGINGTNKINNTLDNDSGVLTVVSCSNVIKLKRVDLIFRSLLHFSCNNNVIIKWHHFGDGNELNNLKEIIYKENINIDKLIIDLHGSVDVIQILNFYKEKKVDLFINLSTHEGIPVSIMECQSFGIPVIATNVGGVSEIVFNGLNGFLLNGNPTIFEVSNAINTFVYQSSHESFRTNSFNNWFHNYNSNRNYDLFLEHISTLK